MLVEVLLGLAFGLIFVALAIMSYWTGRNDAAIEENERRIKILEDALMGQDEPKRDG